ncbi:MAG: aldolase catalytic domain-containing protein [Treponema sp.]|jgi:4-hydroxy 2-oxovalerate aldolase|nr:aldolase catalytic domain-containing protein [Treponema sp.]
MNRFKLLDCTLRDGGYINNWNFGYETICSIIKKLIEAETDYIEVGFLRNCNYDRDNTLYNTIAELKAVLPSSQGNSRYSVMALHNLYDVSKLEPNDGTVDAIRVTFHNYDINEGLAFVQQVMEKGYNVFCNPINIMGYSDVELLNLVEKMNQIGPYAFSIVDTFGSMMRYDLLRIYSLVEHNLNTSIQIGLHLHENLGLSYSLAQHFIELCVSGRHAIIDGSLFGMGRVPGNLSIELMMDYMNRFQGGQYNPNAAYDAIDDYVDPIKKIEIWGYSTAYALSAKYNLHRNYSEYLLGQGKLRVRDINIILSGISEYKKAAYDEKYIEALYLNYQNDSIDDTLAKETIREILGSKEVLVLAPGNSLNRYKDNIDNFITEHKPIIISANYNDITFGAQYNFYSNIRRFEQYSANDLGKTIFITSNVCKAAKDDCIVFNYYDLACDETGLFDNCIIMMIRLLVTLGLNEINIAGFDGFNVETPNYVYKDHHSDKKDVIKQNSMIAKYTEKLRKKININFLTPSMYIK